MCFSEIPNFTVIQILEAAEMLKYCVTFRDKRQINVEIFVIKVLSFTLLSTSLKIEIQYPQS